jgi:hypothetical protein
MSEHKNENEQDRLFEKIMQDVYNDVLIPDATKSWQTVQVRIQKLRRRRGWLRRARITGAILTVSLLINLLLGNHIPVSYASVSSIFIKVKDQVIQFFFDAPDEHSNTNGALTGPPDEKLTESDMSISEQTTLEGAKAKLSFVPLLPIHLPPTYKLDRVRIFKEPDGAYNNIHLEYINETGSVLQLTEQMFDDLTSSIKTDVHKEAGTIKEIRIGDESAVMVILPNKYIDLEWLTQDRLKISLSGQGDEEEILDIANDLQ